MVEISRSSPGKAIHRGSLISVSGFTTAIDAFMDGCSGRCQPFVWTKIAELVLSMPSAIKEHDLRGTRANMLTTNNTRCLRQQNSFGLPRLRFH
jgi:hypothetical protein